jgi:hypothetical protein
MQLTLAHARGVNAVRLSACYELWKVRLVFDVAAAVGKTKNVIFHARHGLKTLSTPGRE